MIKLCFLLADLSEDLDLDRILREDREMSQVVEEMSVGIYDHIEHPERYIDKGLIKKRPMAPEIAVQEEVKIEKIRQKKVVRSEAPVVRQVKNVCTGLGGGIWDKATNAYYHAVDTTPTLKTKELKEELKKYQKNGVAIAARCIERNSREDLKKGKVKVIWPAVEAEKCIKRFCVKIRDGEEQLKKKGKGELILGVQFLDGTCPFCGFWKDEIIKQAVEIESWEDTNSAKPLARFLEDPNYTLISTEELSIGEKEYTFRIKTPRSGSSSDFIYTGVRLGLALDIAASLSKEGCVFPGVKKEENKGNDLCHYVGISREGKQVSCCFESKLHRVFQEQIREKGKGKISWGTADEPNCRGLTQEEASSVDWDDLNLLEEELDHTFDEEKAGEALQTSFKQMFHKMMGI